MGFSTWILRDSAQILEDIDVLVVIHDEFLRRVIVILISFSLRRTFLPHSVPKLVRSYFPPFLVHR